MFRIIADSACDYTAEEAAAAGISLMPLKVRFGEQEYLDKINLTNEEFYKKLRTAAELPKTALVSAGEFLDEYEKYPNEDIVVITISSRLSGTYQSARTAKQLSGRNNIFIIDSGSASLGEALLADKALELRAEHTAAQAAKILRGYAERVRIVGIIDTLKYLVKGGRLSPLQGAAGGILGIKPLLLIRYGEIINIAKARGQTAAYQKLAETVKTRLKIDRGEEIIFGHADNAAGLAKIAEIAGSPKNSRTLTIGSAVGTHTGPGVICMAYFEHALIGSKI